MGRKEKNAIAAAAVSASCSSTTTTTARGGVAKARVTRKKKQESQNIGENSLPTNKKIGKSTTNKTQSTASEDTDSMKSTRKSSGKIAESGNDAGQTAIQTAKVTPPPQQFDINQRPRRQIKHKYIKSMSRYYEDNKVTADTSITSAIDTNKAAQKAEEVPVNELEKDPSIAPSSAPTATTSNSLTTKTKKQTNLANLRRSGRQNRSKDNSLSEIDEVENSSSKHDEPQPPDDLIQIIEVLDENFDNREEVVETTPVDTDNEEYELIYVDDSSLSQDNVKKDETIMTNDTNEPVSPKIIVEKQGSDTYLLTLDNTMDNSSSPHSNDSLGEKEFYVEISDSLDSDAIIEVQEVSSGDSCSQPTVSMEANKITKTEKPQTFENTFAGTSTLRKSKRFSAQNDSVTATEKSIIVEQQKTDKDELNFTSNELIGEPINSSDSMVSDRNSEQIVIENETNSLDPHSKQVELNNLRKKSKKAPITYAAPMRRLTRLNSMVPTELIKQPIRKLSLHERSDQRDEFKTPKHLAIKPTADTDDTEAKKPLIQKETKNSLANNESSLPCTEIKKPKIEDIKSQSNLISKQLETKPSTSSTKSNNSKSNEIIENNEIIPIDKCSSTKLTNKSLKLRITETFNELLNKNEKKSEANRSEKAVVPLHIDRLDVSKSKNDCTKKPVAKSSKKSSENRDGLDDESKPLDSSKTLKSSKEEKKINADASSPAKHAKVSNSIVNSESSSKMHLIDKESNVQVDEKEVKEVKSDDNKKKNSEKKVPSDATTTTNQEEPASIESFALNLLKEIESTTPKVPKPEKPKDSSKEKINSKKSHRKVNEDLPPSNKSKEDKSSKRYKIKLFDTDVDKSAVRRLPEQQSSSDSTTSIATNDVFVKIRRSRWESKDLSKSSTNDSYSILSDCYLPKQVKHDESLYSIQALKAAEAAAKAAAIADAEAARIAMAKAEVEAKIVAAAKAKAIEEKIKAETKAKAEAEAKAKADAEAIAKAKADAEAKAKAAKAKSKSAKSKLDTKSKSSTETKAKTDVAEVTKLVTNQIDAYGLCATKDLYNSNQYGKNILGDSCNVQNMEIDENFFTTEYNGVVDHHFADDDNKKSSYPILSEHRQPIQDIDMNTDERKPRTETNETPLVDSSFEEDTSIRRSGRIKTITETKQRAHGFGLVRDKERFQSFLGSDVSLNSSDSQFGMSDLSNASSMDVSELEKYARTIDSHVKSKEELEKEQKDVEEGLQLFVQIVENEFRSERNISKEAKRMTCDCFLTKSEIDRGELGCGEDCLNRLLMIECGVRCIVGDRCTNKRFQKRQNSDCTIFKTDKKGYGLRASSIIQAGEFVMEYVGEVLNSKQFEERANEYSKDNNRHHYFMALRSDCVIDATLRGNISRFINHSCDPNAETQKWTVNGELRIGFFSTKTIYPDEEITFDYQFQRYGKAAQKCYCEAHCCRGWIGEEPDSDEEYCEEDDEEEEEEEEVTTAAVKIENITEPKSELSPSIPSEIIESKVEPNDTKSANIELQIEDKPIEQQISTGSDEFIIDKSEMLVENIVTIEKKKKKLKKVSNELKLYKKHIKNKKAEIMEDPDLDNEITILINSNLKNQVHTLQFSRLMVRAKLYSAKSKLLYILRNGELACRRLFLDYHGLKLLYTWMCDAISTDMKQEWSFRLEILETLEVLPIPNKTMLQDSKVLVTIRKWANITNLKENMNKSPEESQSDSGSGTPISDDVVSPKVDESILLKNIGDIGIETLKEIIDTNEKNEQKLNMTSTAKPVVAETAQIKSTEGCEEVELMDQIRFIASKLVAAWDQLPEVFRIPKKLRIEQMKEHEREANRSYQALGLEELNKSDNRYKDRYRGDKDKDLYEKDRNRDRERSSNRFRDAKDPDSYLSKLQRRQLFEAKVAKESVDRNKCEKDIIHSAKCTFFRLDPRMVSERDMPFSVNPVTGQWYSQNGNTVPTPPSHAHIKPPPVVMSTNPNDYILPTMDLPDFWKFAIDTTGRLYYYHVKIRIPQWEPPIKLLPLMAEKKVTGVEENLSIITEDIGQDDDEIAVPADEKSVDSESDENSSTTDSFDSSDEELETKLNELKSSVKAKQSDLQLMLTQPLNLDEEINALATTSDAIDQNDSCRNSSGGLAEMSHELISLGKKRRPREGLVQERIISPRTEEERVQIKLEMRRYKENKEKLRRRKEESRKRKMLLVSSGPVETLSRKLTKITEGLPIVSHHDDTDDETDTSSVVLDTSSSSLLDQSAISGGLLDDKLTILGKNKIVDELDVLKDEKPLYKQPKLDFSSGRYEFSLPSSSQQKTKRRKYTDTQPSVEVNSDAARRIKDKFRADIAGVIVQHLGPYRKDSCKIGRITNNPDFKHLAKKLTHFVMLKELKHCDNTVNVLEVTESVKVKSKEFIRKYMSKFGEVYEKPENEPEYKDFTC